MGSKFELLNIDRQYFVRCCEVEAKAFNQLRNEWGQPRQQPRRLEWLNYFMGRFPNNGVIALQGGEIIGFALAHNFGSLGWIGPLVVMPENQGMGVGRALTNWAIEYLKEQGSLTIGLETWPHNIITLGLYLNMGLVPGPLILVLKKRCTSDQIIFSGGRITEYGTPELIFSGLRKLSEKICPGLDYVSLARTIIDCKMGEVIYWGKEEDPNAVAIVRHQSYFQNTLLDSTNIDLLMIRPGKEKMLKMMISELESLTIDRGLTEFRMSVGSHSPQYLTSLVRDHKFQVSKTRLRLYAKELPIPVNFVNFFSYSV
ncbi:MAG: GNAT family N-acetyltransferase [Anaerolineaceae bacterium]|nr:GNAT family N-acetyltransferase [Anaerolineaceae bacterium]